MHQGGVGTQWYHGVLGALGAGRECRYSGTSRGIGGFRGLLEGVREPLGPSWGVGVHWGLVGSVGTQEPAGYRWLQGAPRGCQGAIGAIMGCRGALGAGRECRYSGASRGIGGIRGLLGGVGAVRRCRRCQGAIGGVGVDWRWQVDWEPNHIGLQSRVPTLPLVPLRE